MSNLEGTDAPVLDYAAAQRRAQAHEHARAHRAERSRRLVRSLVSALLTKPLAFVVPLITVPLFLNYLGRQRYGLYESIGALTVWVTLSNGGLFLGLLNKLTDTYVSGDRALARRYVSTMFVAMYAVAAAGVAVLVVAVPLVDWAFVFPNPDATVRAEVPWAVFTAAALTLGGLTIGVNPIYTAYQELHRNNLWEAAARIAGLAASFAVTQTDLGIVGVVAAASGVPLVVRLLNAVYLFTYEMPWLMPSVRLFDPSLLRSMLAQGLCFLLLNAAVIAIYESDKLIILWLLGPAEVTRYAVPGRLFLMVYGIFVLLIAPMWPAHGEALRRGDLAWVRRGLRTSVLVGCAMVVSFGATMYFFGDRAIALWTRNQAAPLSKQLVLGMTAVFALRAWVDSRSIILNSAGVLLPQMAFFGAHAVLNLILAVLLGKRYGVEGVAWATALSSLVTSAWGYPFMVGKYVFRPPAPRPDALPASV